MASSAATKISVYDRFEVFQTKKNRVIVEDFRIMGTIM